MFYVIGDIHGSAADLYRKMSQIETDSADVVLCLGDVGLKYGSYVMGSLRSEMSRYPCTFLVMRGNHDVRYCRELRAGTYGPKAGLPASGEPTKTTGRHLEQRSWCGIDVLVDSKYDNILYLPDEGGMFTRNGKNCLIIPGAYSVDGPYRKRKGWPFEPDELLTEQEMEKLGRLAKENRIDYIFSHTAPLSWEPYLSYLFMDGIDQSAVDKSMEFWMDDVLSAVQETCASWYFGHFHDDYNVPGGIGHMLYREVAATPELS